MQDAPLGLTSQVIAMKASADTRDITVTGRPLTDADRPADAGGNAITVTGKKLPDSSDNAITVTGHPTRSTDNAITVTGHPTQSTGNAITVTGRPLNSTDTRQTQ